MTCGEFAEWIKENGYEDRELRIQYRDEGGDYSGTDSIVYLWEETEEDNTKVIIL